MRNALGLVAILALPGCASAPQLPAELRYVMPGSDTSGVSTINATMIDDKVPLFDDDNTYVYAVDGKKVMLGEKDWDKPVYILPGEHDITLGFTKGAHMLFAKVTMRIHESSQYKATSICKEGFLGNYEYCDFWVVDVATGKAVSEVSRGPYRNRVRPLDL